MGKRDALIAKYAADLRDKCGITPDLALLDKVTIGCGPAIYDPTTEIVAADQQSQIDHIRRAFLVRKLGLPDGPDLEDAIDAAIETYGRSEPRKYRAVIHYMLVRHFRKEGLYR